MGKTETAWTAFLCLHSSHGASGVLWLCLTRSPVEPSEGNGLWLDDSWTEDIWWDSVTVNPQQHTGGAKETSFRSWDSAGVWQIGAGEQTEKIRRFGSLAVQQRLSKWFSSWRSVFIFIRWRDSLWFSEFISQMKQETCWRTPKSLVLQMRRRHVRKVTKCYKVFDWSTQ